MNFHLKSQQGAAPVAQRFSAAFSQGLILETLNQVPRRAPCMEPASPSACVSAPPPLSASLMNKQLKS